MSSVRSGTKTGIVKGNPFGRVDAGVGSYAAGAIEFLDIGPDFIEGDPARLARTVGENNDVLCHCSPLTVAE